MTTAFTPSALDGAGFQGAFAVDPRGNGVLLCGGDVSGIHRSTNNGVTWIPANAGFYNTNQLKVASLAFVPDHPTIAIACVGSKGVVEVAGVWVSTDNGKTWSPGENSPAFSGGNTNDPSLWGPHPRSTGTLVAFDEPNGRIYVGSYESGVQWATFNAATGDIGTVWTTVALNNYFIRSIAFDEPNDTLYVACVDLVTPANDGVFKITTLSGTPSLLGPISGAPASPEEFLILEDKIYTVTADVSDRGAWRASLSDTSTWTKINGGDLDTVSSRWQSITGTAEGGAHVVWVGCSEPDTEKIGGTGPNIGNSIMRCDDAESATPTWTSITFLADDDVPKTMGGPFGPEWWLSIETEVRFFMVNRGSYIAAFLAIINGKLFSAGRSGIWRCDAPSGNPVDRWYPCVNGIGATINREVKASATQDERALIGNVDWVALQTDDAGETLNLVRPSPNAGFSVFSMDDGAFLIGVGDRDDSSEIGAAYACPSGDPFTEGWDDLEIGNISLVTFLQDFGTPTSQTWPDGLILPDTSVSPGFSSAAHKDDCSCDGAAGFIDLSSGNGARQVRYSDVALASGNVVGRTYVERSAHAVGGWTSIGASVAGQWDSGDNTYYEFRIREDTSGVLELRIYRVILGVATEIGTPVTFATLGIPWGVGQQLDFKYKLTSTGSGDPRLRCKIWPIGAEQPSIWHRDETDTHVDQIVSPGAVGVVARATGDDTNTAIMSYRDWWVEGTSAGTHAARCYGIAGASDVGSSKVLLTALQESDSNGNVADPIDSGGVWKKVDSGPWVQKIVPSVADVTKGGLDKVAPFCWPVQSGPLQTVFWYDKTKGVYRSNDSGENWVRIWNNPSDVARTGFLAANDPSLLLVSANGEAYGINNADTVGTDSAVPTNITPPGASGLVSALTVTPDGKIWVAQDADLGKRAALWVSSDNGDSWLNYADEVYESTALFVFDLSVDMTGRVYVALNGNGVLVGTPVTEDFGGIVDFPVGGEEEDKTVKPLPHEWKVYAVDIKSGQVREELPAGQLSYTKELNRSGTFSFQIPLNVQVGFDSNVNYDKVTNNIIDATNTVVLFVRSGVILFAGVVWTVKVISDVGVSEGAVGGRIEIGGMGIWSYYHRTELRHRRSYVDVEQLAIAEDLFEWVTQHYGNNDIRTTVAPWTASGVARDRTYNYREYQFLGPLIEQLSEVINGFEFDIVTDWDNLDRVSMVSHQLRFFYPRMGSTKGYSLELGRNVTYADWTSDGAAQANAITATGAGEGKSRLVASAHDFQSRPRDPRVTTVLQYSDVSKQETLQDKANEQLELRRDPIQIPTIRTQPAAGFDCGCASVGDNIRFIAQTEYMDLDRWYRIIKWTNRIEENDDEHYTLELAPILDPAFIDEGLEEDPPVPQVSE